MDFDPTSIPFHARMAARPAAAPGTLRPVVRRCTHPVMDRMEFNVTYRLCPVCGHDMPVQDDNPLAAMVPNAGGEGRP